MPQGVRSLLTSFGRSTIGALNLGMPLLYTMETWWLADTLPLWVLVTFALGGLALISVVSSVVGFEEGSERPGPARIAADFVELLLASFLAAYIVLALFGILGLGEPLHRTLRHGLMQVVPLALGGAVANAVFTVADEERERGDAPTFAKEMATFAVGAAFFAFAIAPTEEVSLMAARAGWGHLILVVLVSLAFTHVVLYVVEFRGRAGRLAGLDSHWLRWGETAAGYAVALGVSFFLLFGYGHLDGVSLPEAVQKAVVLSLVASFGGAAARVVV